MTGRFAGLKDIQHPEEELSVEETTELPKTRKPRLPSAVPQPPAAQAPALRPEGAARPWEVVAQPVEPVKALNGRVPRSVRLAFDRQLTDAMETLRTDITVDLAVEALARLVTEHEDVRERWLGILWELKKKT
ncbi:hypothetical protein [Deinococcus ruber]|uniref:Uncharacterized protein n=1 Tax=Deinococcus ruber TaxID=1848197 RepID=A0A918FE99_9DEIO|nr:hypothetical protein [Deinococcus ruber]GGR27625.1 hypothetical protein GCM10008957_43740 [Deinococcus ruber]